MARGVTDSTDWVTERTDGAPPRLQARVREWFGLSAGATRVDRLAHAGTLALAAADVSAADRGSALDLLAADALITLALLDQAERAPESLADAARRLRSSAVEAV